MNTNFAIIAFLIAVSGLIWAGTSQNDPTWTGSQHACVGECYDQWKSGNGGGIAEQEQAKQAALAAASPEALGENYFAACIACHGGNGGGGIGPQLAGRDADYIVGRLTAYKANETVGAQSALMWGQAAMLSEEDMQQLAEYITTF